MAEKILIDDERGPDAYDSPQVDGTTAPFVDATVDEPVRGTETERKRPAVRGFAAMDREKQKRIASEGGRAAHKQGVAHEWNKDEAKAAGRKGGQTVSRNREYMSEIGRRGGQNSGLRRQGSASSE